MRWSLRWPPLAAQRHAPKSEMQIVRRGSGPALVMLHGWAMHSGIFASLLVRLQENFTLYLVDLPGHGRSVDSGTALELDAVARQVAAHTPTALWFGWSLGGLIALYAAQHLPASVRGLLMICASPRFMRAKDWPQGMDESVFRSFAEQLGSDFRGSIDRFSLLEAQGSGQLRSEARLLRAQAFAYGEPSRKRLREGLAVLQNSDLRGGLPMLKMPSLWIAGDGDRLVSAQSMQLAATRAAKGEYLCIEHSGHAPFLTYADDIADAIERFAATVPA